MKTIKITSLILFVCFSFTGFYAKKSPVPEILKTHRDKASFTKLTKDYASFIPLFNGQNLKGWYVYTQKDGIKKEGGNQFRVEGGAIHLDGANMGYLCTDKSYKNYYLRVVFRWGEKKYPPRENSMRDSGILYHFPVTEKDKLWPKSIEFQVQENDCGDYWCVGGTNAESPNPGRMEGSQKRIIRTGNFEKPIPEWNTLEIICLDNRSEHYVNGHLVNEATGLTVSEGKILLQLEGAEVFYKSVNLLPLK
ncbi:MAG: DUF1080 domain-containing protein [Tannerella sp.]|jgi:hypothetical protein|nr:DUF1080 domain-containing protein [Tannerella sp.]